MAELVLLIRLIATIITWFIIASAVLSYILSPYHPVRMAFDRILEPFLNPIRRIIPPAGMIDFSPLILLGLVQLVSWILVSALTQ